MPLQRLSYKSIVLGKGGIEKSKHYIYFKIYNFLNYVYEAWHSDTSLILTLRRQRLVDLHEFKASMAYTVSSRPARVYALRPCVKNKQTKILSMCVSMYMKVPVESRKNVRSPKVPGGSKLPDVGARNSTWVLWKNSTSS